VLPQPTIERDDDAAADPLALDPETMRRLGHETVDLLVAMLHDPEAPALRRASPAEMRRRIAPHAPEAPGDFEALLAQLRDDVFAHMSRLDHPRYFAFIPACGTWPSALGDFLASAMNVYAGSWMEAAGPSRLELVVLDWFKEWIGYPKDADGVLVSGGSTANMTALACAREALAGAMSDRLVAYVSDQAHCSLARTARLLGFAPNQVRVLPTDERFRLRPDALEAAIDADLEAGREPLFVAAAAGATNTGAIDPLPEVAEICRARGVWLHVDGAYGGFAALTGRGRRSLRGIELADSVTLDPHKWLYQPFECGSLLVRDAGLLDRAFAIAPDYLRDATVHDEEVNFSDRGLQLSRSCRALKVWLSIQYFGVDAFRTAIDRCLDLALRAEDHVAGRPELELLSPANLGVICFRRRPEPGEDEEETAQRNADLVARFAAGGDGLVSSTRLRGRYAIRLCVMNHTTTERDVERVLDWFAEASMNAAAACRPGRVGASAAGAAHRPLRRPEFSTEQLARIALFASLTEEQLARVDGWARWRRVAPGAQITRRWDASRDFFVVVHGSADVERDGETVGAVAAGGFFGELAAMDWGAGYGYPRLATVIATAPMQLLVLEPSHLHQLMAEAPDFAAHVRGTMRARLATV
jgi:aromatic-L-amino-acid/L-tryptophan decarboxylase